MALTIGLYRPRIAAATTAMCRSAQLAFTSCSTTVVTLTVMSSTRIRFLAKAAYEKSDKKQRADYVKDVTVGDIIHFYFKRLSDPRHVAYTIGTFDVSDDSIKSDH